jgi:uncharacterized protein
MSNSFPQQVSLTSQWFIRKGFEAAAFAALDELAAAVFAGEPDTLSYLVHAPYTGDADLPSLPPTDPSSVLFFEVYRDAEAFEKHVNGFTFTGFVARYGHLFVSANGKPFTFVNFLTRRAGFIR